jgi:IS5 family transposase
MNMKQMDWLSEYKRLERLSELGDPLEKVNENIDWEMFRADLEGALRKQPAGPGGRPSYDSVMMFKIVLLQQWNNIADDRTEFLINDRLSFQRFLGITLGEKVPDSKTIWLFKEKLRTSGVERKLFNLFKEMLEGQKIITHQGSIVDATFVDVPRPRNSREENEQIKNGETPKEWQEPGNEHKLCQKDTDARWTKKNGEKHCGYKDHVKVDADSKIITEYVVGDAAEHDSQAMEELIDDQDEVVYADSAYVGEKMHERIKQAHPKAELRVHEKAFRNCPLTEEQKASNRAKSKIRARVEHVFGHMTNAMGGLFIRTIGYLRACFQIGVKNLAYNLMRYSYLKGIKSVVKPAT